MSAGVVFVIVLALAFDFTNGFHDSANSIATVTATRVLRPEYAVMWAAFFNFAAFLVFGTKVATTIAKDVVDPSAGVITVGVVFAGLVGAIGWNLITFYLGLPSSSSHALVGGVVGAAVARSGLHVVEADGMRKIGVFIVLSPLVGLAAHTAIGLGTLSGGWRIVKTMGSKITRLQPVGGVAAESAAAATLFFTSSAGIPVSTTHTITGAIIGVGATRRLSAVRWGIAGDVVTAWVLTIPGAFVIAYVTSLIVRVVA